MRTVDVSIRNPIFQRPYLILHPQIPKPLHGVNPRTIMGKEWWDEKRRAAYRENNYCCWCCGSSELQPLEAHECYEIDYANGLTVLHEIVALCYLCHAYIHRGRVRNLVMAGKLMEKDAQTIVDHGESISRLVDYNNLPGWLEKTLTSLHTTQTIASWTSWRLLIYGQYVHSPFKSFEEWEQYYQGKSE